MCVHIVHKIYIKINSLKFNLNSKFNNNNRLISLIIYIDIELVEEYLTLKIWNNILHI